MLSSVSAQNLPTSACCACGTTLATHPVDRNVATGHPEAIRVELPVIGTIGYVANSTNTVYRGTASAGRIYDKIGDYAFARIFFVTHSSAIALVLSTDEVEEIDAGKKVIFTVNDEEEPPRDDG